MCTAGWGGSDCKTNIDDCPGKDCGNGACKDGVNTHTCTCNAGWVGADCSEAGSCTAGANGEACKNSGSVAGKTGGCSCTCVNGYTGANCEVDPTTSTITTSTTTTITTTTATTTTTTTKESEAIGFTPTGEKCFCPCPGGCDGSNNFKQLTGSADGAKLIGGMRVFELETCQRACATNLACNAYSYRAMKFTLSSKRVKNCQLFETARRRTRVRNDDEAAVFFEKEPLGVGNPANAYAELVQHKNEHHNGATVAWTAAVSAAACQQACDTTVKCVGVSLYAPVRDGKGCRLVGDSMATGPWTAREFGPWSSSNSWLQSSCTPPEPINNNNADQFRWDENVTIASWVKGGDVEDVLGYRVDTAHQDDLFIGLMLYTTSTAQTEDACMQTCLQETDCTGVSFTPGSCVLHASPMDQEELWLANANRDGGRQRKGFGKLKLKHLIKQKVKKLVEKECTCRPIAKFTTTTAAPRTTATAAPATTTTTTDANDSHEDLCGMDLTDPYATQVCIHGRVFILGLDMRAIIRITKTQASFDANGSLFGSFLKAIFGVHIKFTKPRSFRVFGEMTGESKEETLDRMRAKMQAKASRAQEKYAAKRRVIQQERAAADKECSDKKAELDQTKARWAGKAEAKRVAAEELKQARLRVKAERANVQNICAYKCVKPNRKNCNPVRPSWKWDEYMGHNIWCGKQRVKAHAKLAFEQGELGLKEIANRVAAKAFEKGQKLINVAKRALDAANWARDRFLDMQLAAVNAMEAIGKFGRWLGDKIADGLLSSFQMNHFSFDFLLSQDSRYLEYHLDCKLFGKNIVLDDYLDFTTFRSTMKALVRAIINLVKAVFGKSNDDDDAINDDSYRSRRELSGFDKATRVSSEQTSLALVSQHVPHVRQYTRHRREAAAGERATATDQEPPTFETVCKGLCECKVCIKGVKSFFGRVRASLLKIKEQQASLKRSVMVAESANTAQNRRRGIAETLAVSYAEARAQRANASAMYASIDEECSTADNATSCKAVLVGWEAYLANEENAVDEVDELYAAMNDQVYASEDVVTATVKKQIAHDDQVGWRATLFADLYTESATLGYSGVGGGCAEVECADPEGCVVEAAYYIKENLEELADDYFCPDGYTSTQGGCDRSQQVVQQQAAVLLRQWGPIAASLSTMLNPKANTLGDAIAVVSQASLTLGSVAPAEFCEGRIVVADSSSPVPNQGGTNIHAARDDGEHLQAQPTAVATQNQLLHQLSTYSSVCSGSGLSLTDGTFGASGANQQFSTCVDAESPYIIVEAAEPSLITSVRVGKQCTSTSEDGSVLGLKIVVKTTVGVFDCGAAATADDATCDSDGNGGNDVFWERSCNLPAALVATAVVLTRDGAGAVQTSEIQAFGRPLAVSNVLLGQAAQATSQCHERVSFNEVKKNGDMYPVMQGSTELQVGGEDACLETCFADDGCVAVSFFVAPAVVPGSANNNCIISPGPLLADGVDWITTGIVDSETNSSATANPAEVHHYSKHLPLQRLEAYRNHVHDGALLSQACVPDLAECKARCAADLHCTGITFFGDNDDIYSPSVCAMTGNRADDTSMASHVFSEGPFAQLPTTGISANLGRPPRMGESSEYNATENYGIVLGLDKISDGFFQPLDPLSSSGTYARQGFLHTCGETDGDEVVIPTTEPSRVYSVRVWRRCDCCQHRSVGLQVMQQVQIDATTTEWLACGAVSAEDDSACSMLGPEQQFWERVCNHTLATLAIKVVRVAGVGGNGTRPNDDDDYRSIDIPEIAAFGAAFVESKPVVVDNEIRDGELEEEGDLEEEEYGLEMVLAKYLEAKEAVELIEPCNAAAGNNEEDQPSATPSRAVRTEPLLVCTVSTTTSTTSTPTEVDGSASEEQPEEEEEEVQEETVEDSEGAVEGSAGGLSPGGIAGIVISIIALLAGAAAVLVFKRRHDTNVGVEGDGKAMEGVDGVVFTNPAYDASTDDLTDDAGMSGDGDGYLDIATAEVAPPATESEPVLEPEMQEEEELGDVAPNAATTHTTLDQPVEEMVSTAVNVRASKRGKRKKGKRKANHDDDDAGFEAIPAQEVTGGVLEAAPTVQEALLPEETASVENVVAEETFDGFGLDPTAETVEDANEETVTIAGFVDNSMSGIML